MNESRLSWGPRPLEQPQALNQPARNETHNSPQGYNQPPNAPEKKPIRPTRRQYIRRRIGAAALAASLGLSGAHYGPQAWEKLTADPWAVDDRTPKDNEICAIDKVNKEALLVVAASFTDDMSSRRAGAWRIRRAIDGQPSDRYGVCYDPDKDYSRVLTHEAVKDLPPGRLVSWNDFPGRTDRLKN